MGGGGAGLRCLFLWKFPFVQVNRKSLTVQQAEPSTSTVRTQPCSGKIAATTFVTFAVVPVLVYVFWGFFFVSRQIAASFSS